MKSTANYLYFLFVCGTVDGFSQVREVEVFSQTDLVETAPPTEVVFIGFQENNHHSPSHLYDFLEPSFLSSNLNVTFRDSAVITDEVLEPYDAVIMYGNLRTFQFITTWPEVPTLIRYVERGGGFVPMHVTAASFRFTEPFAALMGARFASHTAASYTHLTLPTILLV